MLWLMLAVFGLIATVNHLILVQAFKRAPASILAPIQYLEIVTGVILGWMIWDYVPNALKWVGIAIIVSSGLFIIWRERVTAQRDRATQANDYPCSDFVKVSGLHSTQTQYSQWEPVGQPTTKLKRRYSAEDTKSVLLHHAERAFTAAGFGKSEMNSGSFSR